MKRKMCKPILLNDTTFCNSVGHRSVSRQRLPLCRIEENIAYMRTIIQKTRELQKRAVSENDRANEHETPTESGQGTLRFSPGTKYSSKVQTTYQRIENCAQYCTITQAGPTIIFNTIFC